MQHLLNRNGAFLYQNLTKMRFSPINDKLHDKQVCTIITVTMCEERSCSVVERLTRDRGAAGSSLTGVTALLSLIKTHLS